MDSFFLSIAFFFLTIEVPLGTELVWLVQCSVLSSVKYMFQNSYLLYFIGQVRKGQVFRRVVSHSEVTRPAYDVCGPTSPCPLLFAVYHVTFQNVPVYLARPNSTL